MAAINWKITTKTIQAGKSILFIGPEVFKNKNGEQLEERLRAYLDISSNSDTKYYDDGLFYFKERYNRTETYMNIREFFKEEDFTEAEDLFKKIAHIPFHLIILLTPDKTLTKVYQNLDLPVDIGYYTKPSVQVPDTKIPTKDAPLIYNILGSLDSPESLVLTHKDLYSYLENVFQAKGMFGALKKHITKEAQSIIFLGIPFDRWYMQLLLRILNMHEDNDFMRFAVEQETNESIHTFCKEQFKINFIPNKLEDFVSELHKQCTNIGILRDINMTSKPILNEVEKSKVELVENLTKLLEEGAFQEVIDQLKDYFKKQNSAGKDFLDQVILISGQYGTTLQRIREGTITEITATPELNQFRKSLLQIVNSIKEEEEEVL